MAAAKDRAHAAFEFFTKLGVDYYAFHDRDVAPEGANLAETNANLDAVADTLEQLQKETGVKLLWGTANLFSNPRFMNGGATNPDFTTVIPKIYETPNTKTIKYEYCSQNLNRS